MIPHKGFWRATSLTPFDFPFRKHFWWPSLLVLAAFAYIYAVDGIYVPRIGDEAPYIQIVRLTAESGNWLPLKSVSGLENTKPPLLFWMGILSTNWAQDWTLFRLRFPIVVFTFLTAGLVFLLANRIAGSRESGYLGALSFLGFFATFKYGRPFLTNLPETLFIFLPFFLVIYLYDRVDAWGIRLWLLVGLSIGVACLYKSFVLIIPMGFALSWIYLAKRGWDLSAFLRRDALGITIALVVSLMCFSLWPLLDPHPELIIKQFVVKENLGKLGEYNNYFRGLFSGGYPIYRIWLGHLWNGGLFALPVVYVAVTSFKNRAELRMEEKALWIVILSFLIVYTVPSQRQENYLLPTSPALAVVLGLHWMEIKRQWFYAFNVPILVVLLGLTALMYMLSGGLLPPGSYHAWQMAVPFIALVLLVGCYIINRASPYLFHLLAFLTFISFSCAVAPFEGPLGGFRPETIAALQGSTVYVPSNFASKYERHRFVLPGVDVRGYDPSNKERVDSLLKAREIVAVNHRPGHPVEDFYKVYGKRWNLWTRHTREQMFRIVFHQQLDLLVREEIIIQRRRGQ